MAIATKLVFALIWTFLLGWLCSKGLKTLSWFLVLLPYILIAVMFVLPKKKVNDEGLRLGGQCGASSECRK